MKLTSLFISLLSISAFSGTLATWVSDGTGFGGTTTLNDGTTGTFTISLNYTDDGSVVPITITNPSFFTQDPNIIFNQPFFDGGNTHTGNAGVFNVPPTDGNGREIVTNLDFSFSNPIDMSVYNSTNGFYDVTGLGSPVSATAHSSNTTYDSSTGTISISQPIAFFNEYYTIDSLNTSNLNYDITRSDVSQSNSGYRIAFVDNTVPEPSSFALLGLGGLALVSRRKRS